MGRQIGSVLDGIRVLDWTVWQQGPVAAMMLGELGAEIIKIEARGAGDPARGLMQLAGASTGVVGRNFYFENNNRNKKSLALDLTKKKGREIVYKLVEKSDVFLQNFRTGVASRLGLDYAILSQYNSRLVYASASGWGQAGPDAQRPVFDYTAQARSGLMTMVGEPDTPPLIVHGAICDQLGAMTTAYGVLAALLERERSGLGQEVDGSLLGSMIWLQSLSVSTKLLTGMDWPRRARAAAGNPLSNHYECRDGKWIVLACLQSERHWPALCRVLGMVDLEHDPRFDNMAVRAKNAAALVAIMDGIFATKTREEWVKALNAEVDLVFECVNTISDVVNDPQSRVNGYITEFEHPSWGPIKVVGSPVKLSRTPAAVQCEAPELGQHTEEILVNVLGFSWEEIETLQIEEVI